MTLGERITSLRKEKGLTQEALGELIGVSRQAVSKWEADRAVPDVSNCVAMCKVFKIPLTQLLMMDDENNSIYDINDAADVVRSSDVQPELDEKHLKLVEQLTERYISAQRKVWRRYRWPFILIICIFMVFAAWLWEWLTDMNRTIDYLHGELAGMQGEIISGVGNRVQESLDAENSLIADYSIQVVEADIPDNTLTYDVNVSLKSWNDTTQVSFMSRCGGEIYNASSVNNNGLNYTGQITCPILDDTAIYVIVNEGGQSRCQLLDTMYIASDYALHTDGWIRYTALGQSGLSDRAFEPVEIYTFVYRPAGLKKPIEVTDMEIGIFKNDKKVDGMNIDTTLGSEHYNEWSFVGSYDIPVKSSIASSGDTLTFALLVRDNYGRTASRILSRYHVLDGGELNYQAEEMMELDDGTYGTEEW